VPRAREPGLTGGGAVALPWRRVGFPCLAAGAGGGPTGGSRVKAGRTEAAGPLAQGGPVRGFGLGRGGGQDGA
jgi:hypothetical protein